MGRLQLPGVSMRSVLINLPTSESGASLVEYCILTAFLVFGITTSVWYTGKKARFQITTAGCALLSEGELANLQFRAGKYGRLQLGGGSECTHGTDSTSDP